MAQLIPACKDYLGICDGWYYWASAASNGMEVDFLLERRGEFIAVETKAGRSFSESWCRGLRALGGLKGLRRRLVVYPEGPSLQTADGIEVVPFARFSELLHGEALWL